MRFFLLFMLTSVVILSSCQRKLGLQTTEMGNEFIRHTNLKSGVTAENGMYAYIHASIRNGDSVVFNTRDDSSLPTAIQILPDSLGRDRVGPVEDAIRGLSEGDSLTVILPIDTMKNKPPGFEDADVIYYDIVITEVITAEAFQIRKEKEAADIEAQKDAITAREPAVLELFSQLYQQYKSGALEGIKTTASGLMYVILETGKNDHSPIDKQVTVNYVGALSEDGNIFDQSFKRGQGISFPLGTGRVIKGWDEGLALLNEGGKALLIIPSKLGYGTSGSSGVIPPNAELFFYVELVDVQ